MRSSLDENLQTPTSLSHSSAYTTSNGNESSRERERTERPQHVGGCAMHVLSPSVDRQQDCQDGHAFTQEQAQPPSNGVGEEQRDHSPDVNNQGYESTTHDASGIVPKMKRKFRKRTKTGCITCRRKKIKCGEERPQCEYCTIASDWTTFDHDKARSVSKEACLATATLQFESQFYGLNPESQSLLYPLSQRMSTGRPTTLRSNGMQTPL